MCDFCHKHGEGKKWYLHMENYSKELFAQKKRKEFMQDFYDKYFGYAEKQVSPEDKLKELAKSSKLVQKVSKSLIVRKYKKNHFGQVIPVEDLEELLPMVDVIVRIPCVCRLITVGKNERYCFGLGAAWDRDVSNFPIFSGKFDVVEKDEFMNELKKFDEKGLIHSIWTFKAPFIGSICNCDQDCLTFKTRIKYQTPVFFKAEYVAQTDWDKCSGCKSCKMVCQFGAITYSAANDKCEIDLNTCFGCGVCRASCPNQAITLIERISVPELVNNW